MRDQQARALLIKQSRRDLLTALNCVYPYPFAFASICQALAHLELPDQQCVERDISYLIDKDYIKCVNDGTYHPWRKRFYLLTAKGNEIANRIEIDPALEP